MAMVALALLVVSRPAEADPLPGLFADPVGYPTAWPGALATASYPSQGVAQADLSVGAGDASNGPAVYLNHQDFSSGAPSGTLPSVYYTASGSVAYFRVRLASNPLETGKDGPFKATRWNVLLDVDGDGYKEFVLQVNGATSNTFVTQPDNFATYYNNTASQVINTVADRLWEQDVGGPSDGVDGGLNPDSDADPRIWDYGRTRVVQINTGLPAGDAGSEYFLDIQVPLGAFNATGLGGPELLAADCWQMAFTTSDSPSNPTQQDLIYPGTFEMAIGGGSPIPFGDVVCSGTPQGPPVVKVVTAAVCPSPVALVAEVVDAIVDNGANVAQDSLASVRFEYYQDGNGNNLADDGGSWTLIGNGVTGAFLSQFTFSWNTSGLPMGNYLVRVVAQDDSGNVKDSFTQAVPGARFATFNNTCGTTGGTILGTIYEDTSGNGAQDGSEAGTGVAYFVKLVDSATPGGPALLAVPANLTTGDFTIFTPTAGTFNLVIDDNNTLADVTPTTPGYVGTQAPTGIRSGLVVTTGSVTSDQDFGLFAGSFFTGRVFRDDGAGGGTANDGVQNGAEVGIAAVEMELRTAADAVLLRTTTDSLGDFRFLVPGGVGAVPLKVVERGPSPSISTGASLGNTAGAYDRATDALTFTNVIGASFTGVRFGDVDPPRFTEDHQAQSRAGMAVYYPHRFVPGSGGSVTYTVSTQESPVINGWSAQLYVDTDCDGVLVPADPLVTGPVAVAVGVPHCTVLRVFVPQGAPIDAQQTATIDAAFSYTAAVPALAVTLTNVDVTGVGGADGLELVKAVDVATARPGDLVTYTITYTNTGSVSIANLVIADATPGFTTFQSAANGALPASLTAVTPTTPGVGGTGPVLWTFTGALDPGRQGTVTFVVQID